MIKKLLMVLFFSVFILPSSFAAQAVSFKKIGIGKEYGEPLYSGKATLTGTYTRNYEDYTVMGVENPVCFELSGQDLRSAPTPISNHFCFTNSKQAHNLLNLPVKAKKGCFYQGKATITIKDFSNFSDLDPSVFDMTFLLSVGKVSSPIISCDN